MYKAFFILSVGALCYYVKNLLFNSTDYVFCIDSRLSEAVAVECQMIVRNSYGALAYTADRLKKEFAAIERVEMWQDAYKKLHVTIQAAKPHVCLNNQLILLSSGAVVSVGCFTKDIYKNIPLVGYIGPCLEMPVSEKLKQWLLHFDLSMLSHYAISYRDDYEIIIHNKASSYAKILCSIETPIDQKMSALCERIIQVKGQMVQGTAPHSLYTADIRFEKQIIVRSQRRGAYG